ncbi:Uncharacterised protein [Morganella morganii]|nr:Uncharacterised protein [Morganella morganii]
MSSGSDCQRDDGIGSAGAAFERFTPQGRWPCCQPKHSWLSRAEHTISRLACMSEQTANAPFGWQHGQRPCGVKRSNAALRIQFRHHVGNHCHLLIRGVAPLHTALLRDRRVTAVRRDQNLTVQCFAAVQLNTDESIVRVIFFTLSGQYSVTFSAFASSANRVCPASYSSITCPSASIS